MDSLSKKQLRKDLREKRARLSYASLQAHAQAATQLFLATPLFQQNQHIACYLAEGGELDPALIIAATLEQNKSCYLPCIVDAPNQPLAFVRYQKGDPLVTHRLGIQQPIYQKHLVCPLIELDCLLIPLIAYDEKGTRLGRGGGYYDKSLAFARSSSKRSPTFIGLAHSFQKVLQLPRDAWDIHMDAILTEQTFTWIRP